MEDTEEGTGLHLFGGAEDEHGLAGVKRLSRQQRDVVLPLPVGVRHQLAHLVPPLVPNLAAHLDNHEQTPIITQVV